MDTIKTNQRSLSEDPQIQASNDEAKKIVFSEKDDLLFQRLRKKIDEGRITKTVVEKNGVNQISVNSPDNWKIEYDLPPKKADKIKFTRSESILGLDRISDLVSKKIKSLESDLQILIETGDISYITELAGDQVAGDPFGVSLIKMHIEHFFNHANTRKDKIVNNDNVQHTQEEKDIYSDSFTLYNKLLVELGTFNTIVSQNVRQLFGSDNTSSNNLKIYTTYGELPEEIKTRFGKNDLYQKEELNLKEVKIEQQHNIVQQKDIKIMIAKFMACIAALKNIETIIKASHEKAKAEHLISIENMKSIREKLY